MTEEIPVASGMPECNGSVPPEKGPLQVIGVVDEIAKSVGTVPYTNAEMSPGALLAEGNQEENRNSLAEDTVHGDLGGEKQCEEKREENNGMLQRGSADTQGPGTDGQELEEGPGSKGTTARRSGEAAGTLGASSDGHGDIAEEEEEEEEEEDDTEEDEVQVIELKKENSTASGPTQQGGGREAPASPGANSPAERPGEQPGLGKKNDISRHSYSRYNTISYRRIRKGNTKQRIDEFESMMHL
ncbi:ERMIN protein, partial [Psophia crepitans]|nr:ERMIN protein [Psophia crepitans]